MQLNEDKPYDDINITPMLDLAYVLLVIFILMCTASVQGMKVNLPKASKAPSLGKPKTKSITVNNEGKVFLDTAEISLSELETRLAALKAATPDLPLVIRGDRITQYQSVMEVLDVVGRVGIAQVGLATVSAKSRAPWTIPIHPTHLSPDGPNPRRSRDSSSATSSRSRPPQLSPSARRFSHGKSAPKQNRESRCATKTG